MPLIHLAPRADIAIKFGSIETLCNRFVTNSPTEVTSRLLDATCPDCLEDCGCSSAPSPCDTCSSLDLN